MTSPSPVSCAHSSGPSARQNATFVFDGDRDLMLLFGGEGGSPAAPLADTWTWDCQKWTKRSPAPAPAARELAAADFDSDRHAVLLFGGEQSADSALGDTWTWNGSAWSELHPTVSPPARMGAALAFSPTLHRAILFGGFDGKSFLDDTWSWDGSTWGKMATGAAPAARADAGFAFDGERLILFGGRGASAAYGDTWAFDGEWKQLTTQSAPPKRAEARLAADIVNGSLVLFGGRQSGASGPALGDTWTWTGGVWTESKVSAPPERSGFALGFYPPAQQTVLFGGTNGNQLQADTWLWNSRSWAAL
jgi:Galactose oxidase, central domain